MWLTSAKLMLIQASIHLSYNKVDDLVEKNLKTAKEIFTKLNNKSALGETMYLEAIREIKKMVQKQII